MSSEETLVRLRRNLRLEPSEAPENVTQKHHSLRSATLPRAINRLTQLAESRGGRPLISHLCVPRPLAKSDVRRGGFSLTADAVLELAFILGCVKVALGLRDEPVSTNLPHLVPTEPNPLSGAARSSVRAP